MAYNFFAVYHDLEDAVRLYHRDIGARADTEIPNVVGFSINRQVNAAASWSATLINESPSRIFSPFSMSNPYRTMLRPDIYTAAHTINRVFYITITLMDYVYTSPYLILENVDYSTDGTVQLSGTDWSKRLTIENQSMTSWVSKPGDIKYARNILAEILTKFGCESADLTGFEDFPVKILNFQNEKPWDPILRMLDIKGCHWCVKMNNQLKFWVPQDYSNGPSAWTFEHGVSMLNLRYTNSSGKIYNKVTIGKSDANSGIVGFGEGKDYGRFSISFDPSRNVALVPEMLNNCVLVEKGVYIPTYSGLPSSGFMDYSMTTWTDTEGNKFGYDAPRPVTAMGANPLVQVEFTIGVSGSPLDTGPYIPGPCFWRLHVAGKKVSEEAEVFGPFEELKNIVVKDSELIAAYGECPAPDIPENPLIYDRQCAIDYGRRIIRDSCRMLETCEVAIPLNPAVELGDTVKVICGDLDINHYFSVEGVNLGIDFGSKSVTCNIACSKYQHNLLPRT
jgi:hypothetical protein